MIQAEESLSNFSLILLGIILLILVYATIGSLFEHKHFHYIHETGMGIFIGGFFGLAVYFLKDLSTFKFDQQVFFYGLLPPMIFAGGYNLKKRKFGQNIKYIILFGLLGTIVSFGVIFGLTYFINSMGWIINYTDSAVVTLSMSLMIKFSATICATDSVAALTLIKPKDHPKLFSIIFGEGMVNDAVAIILFKVVGSIFEEQFHQVTAIVSQDAHSDSTFMILLKILGSFLLTITASLLIGVASALICSKMFAKLRFLAHNPVTEVVMIYLFGIMSYVLAEIFNMSGVITVLVCGVCLAHFNFYNLSITGQLSTGVTFQSISFIAEAMVFVYLGISTIYYFTNQQISITFLFLQLLICVISRMTAVFGLSFITKLLTKKWLVSWYELAIVSMAGTIRGSVAFALILTIQHADVATSIVKSSTLMMVCITTIFLGALMPFFITFCLKRDGKIPPPSDMSIEEITEQPAQSLLTADEKQNDPPKEKKKSFFKMLDEQYLKPFFIYDYVKRKPQIQQFKKLLKLNSPEYKGGQFVALMMAGTRQTVATNVLSSHNFKAHADTE